ncbi:MAG: DUF1989 domain-containing protein [Planctomycetes bacterium]|nr:DUF1989 domain-containing protein [Planctomycetota bacterium]
MTHDTSTPTAARDHARAMAGTVVPCMPTIPASRAADLPPGVEPADVVWHEAIAPGGYAARLLERGTRVRLTNLEGDACAQCVVYNADEPFERLNIADTVKVQWNAYLGAGKLLLSDMGRALMSITEDTAACHDTFCGCSTEKRNAKKYGDGSNSGKAPSARDRLLLGLAKHGLTRRDLGPNVNFFKGVRIEPDGSLTFVKNASKQGDFVTLRAEMRVLLVLANTPHVLDPRKQYTVTPLQVTAWRGPVTPLDDPIRCASPESVRAFQNVEDYYNR